MASLLHRLCSPRVVVGAVLLWAIVQWVVARPEHIAADWMAWRQTDTQAIARNFAGEEFHPLWPRIDWRGAGPGYVETEFQLYTSGVAALLVFVGEDAEWPGQLISLLAIVAALLGLHAWLLSRHGRVCAGLTTLFVLGMQPIVFLSSTVQPDALSFALFVFCMLAFFRYLETGRGGALRSATALGALAALVKPPALQLGIAQFVLVLFWHRPRLREPRLWIAWGVVLGVVAIYLLHASRVYAEYGNTFGILSGGDSKLPTLRSLISPRIHWRLFEVELVWGLGPVALLAAVVLIVRRRADPRAVSLAFAHLVLLWLGLRYAANPYYGPHYHLYGVLAGALFLAGALVACSGVRGPLRFVPVLILFLAVLQYPWTLYRRVEARENSSALELGAELRARLMPGELIIVRSPATAYSPWWRTVNNFEDPRILFTAKAKGFVLPADDWDPEALLRAQRAGARFYVEPPLGDSEERRALRAWLRRHAELVYESEAGTIHRLGP